MSTVTLRPSNDGTISGLDGLGYYAVNDDYDDTKVCATHVAYLTDTYTYPALPIPSDSTINSVTLELRLSNSDNTTTTYAKGCLYITETIYLSSAISKTGTGYETKSVTWYVNPHTLSRFTVAEIDAFEAGPSLKSGSAKGYARCSEVWLIIDYGVGSCSAPIVW